MTHTRRPYAPFLVVVALVLVCAACGGDDDGETVTAPSAPLAVESGTFEVSTTVAFNNCAVQTLLDTVYDVIIDSTHFAMGAEWTGTWDPTTAQGSAESDREQSTIRGCTNTIWTEVNVTFDTPHEFTGNVIYRSRLNGTCGERQPCQTSWTIRGARR